MIYSHCIPSRTVKEAKSPLDFNLPEKKQACLPAGRLPPVAVKFVAGQHKFVTLLIAVDI
jgi:hypothetical protein